jgi:BirA family biotin operon repressor/biotin-[acetyl-CoA-carboxylase] ligase
MMDWPLSYERRVLARVDSTMDEAARVAGSLEGPAWIFAAEQTAARGRRGRLWRHPAGNFAATVVIWPAGGPAQAALRSFVMALALHDALEGLTGAGAALALKWPNDVLVAGGKAAGILLETLPGGALSIGVGVNLVAAPSAEAVEAGALAPVSVLEATGVRIAPLALLGALAGSFARWEHVMATDGFAPVRAAWLARAARLGETVTARLPRAEHRGRFETVDDTGAIVLNTAGQRIAIAAAEIFF